MQNPPGIDRVWVVTYQNQWLALMRCDRIEWMTMKVFSCSTMRHVSIDIDVTNAIDKRKAFRIGKAAFTPMRYSKRLILPFHNNFACLFIISIYSLLFSVSVSLNAKNNGNGSGHTHPTTTALALPASRYFAWFSQVSIAHFHFRGDFARFFGSRSQRTRTHTSRDQRTSPTPM